MSWGEIILGIIYFVLFSGAVFLAVIKDWEWATYLNMANILLIMMLSPESPWREGGIWPNLIFFSFWLWNLSLLAKKKKKPAFRISLLTLGSLVLWATILAPIF